MNRQVTISVQGMTCASCSTGMIDICFESPLLAGCKTRKIEEDEVQVGDILLVRSGSTIQVDGRIVEGRSAIDESMITRHAWRAVIAC